MTKCEYLGFLKKKWGGGGGPSFGALLGLKILTWGYFGLGLGSNLGLTSMGRQMQILYI